MSQEPSLRGPWPGRFIRLAKEVASWSKDPRTKCGAVIVRPDKTIASVGFNGFPRGLPDKEEHLNDREEKHARVIHAEMNAILSAHEPVTGCTLFVDPLIPCERCAVHIVQSGIVEVYATYLAFQDARDYCVRTESIFNDAGVKMWVLP